MRENTLTEDGTEEETELDEVGASTAIMAYMRLYQLVYDEIGFL